MLKAKCSNKQVYADMKQLMTTVKIASDSGIKASRVNNLYEINSLPKLSLKISTREQYTYEMKNLGRNRIERVQKCTTLAPKTKNST